MDSKVVKIVINECYGGFDLSPLAIEKYSFIKGVNYSDVRGYDFQRDDPILIRLVNEMGRDVNGQFSRLVIKDVDKGRNYIIHEYDGFEEIWYEDSIDWLIAE